MCFNIMVVFWAAREHVNQRMVWHRILTWIRRRADTCTTNHQTFCTRQSCRRNRLMRWLRTPSSRLNTTIESSTPNLLPISRNNIVLFNVHISLYHARLCLGTFPQIGQVALRLEQLKRMHIIPFSIIFRALFSAFTCWNLLLWQRFLMCKYCSVPNLYRLIISDLLIE